MAGGRISFLPFCLFLAFSSLFFSSFCRANQPLFYSIDQILETSPSPANTSLESAIRPAFLAELESSTDPSKRILLSGEVGAAFFDTGAEGQFPNDEFRIDEAKLFIDASPGMMSISMPS